MWKFIRHRWPLVWRSAHDHEVARLAERAVTRAEAHARAMQYERDRINDALARLTKIATRYDPLAPRFAVTVEIDRRVILVMGHMQDGQRLIARQVGRLVQADLERSKFIQQP